MSYTTAETEKLLWRQNWQEEFPKEDSNFPRSHGRRNKIPHTILVFDSSPNFDDFPVAQNEF